MTDAAPALRAADVNVPVRVAMVALRVPVCTSPDTDEARALRVPDCSRPVTDAELETTADVDTVPDTVAAAASRVVVCTLPVREAVLPTRATVDKVPDRDAEAAMRLPNNPAPDTVSVPIWTDPDRDADNAAIDAHSSVPVRDTALLADKVPTTDTFVNDDIPVTLRSWQVSDAVEVVAVYVPKSLSSSLNLPEK